MCWALRTNPLILALIACVSATVILSKPSSSQTAPATANSIELILSCLSAGKEVVLFMHTVECADYGTGSDLHRTTAPNRPLDVAKSCDDLDARKSIFANDLRILPGSAIKQIAAQKERLKNSTGIRIIGAIFCDELDLIGLEIDQSLVLDRGVFVHDINGRGFRTHGDLSVDDSLIFEIYGSVALA